MSRRFGNELSGRAVSHTVQFGQAYVLNVPALGGVNRASNESPGAMIGETRRPTPL